MSDPQSSALIISNDTAVVDAIVNNNKSEKVFNARESVQQTLDEPSLLENNSIIIFDIATTDNDVDRSVDQAIKLKQADPTQVLIIVGDKEPLNDILKSHIQPMVYRAFNKPVNPNQMFLSFKSAETLHKELVEKQAAGEDILVIGPQENKTSIDTLAEERKTNPLIYAAIGIAIIGVIAFLFLGGDKKVEQNQVTEIPEPVDTSPSEESDINNQLNDLNQLASNAILDGRYISPKGNNALEYYDQALAIDPYDAIAYDGRKAVAAALRKSYSNLVKKEKFDEALTTVNALSAIEPLNPENEKLQTNLQKAVAAAAEKENQAGEAKAAAERAALLAKIESSKKASSTVSNARKTEQNLINQIQSSLSNNNLIPPQNNNAYSLLSNSLKSNQISKRNASPLIQSLSSKLLARANATFSSDNLTETNRLMGLINRIDGGSSGLASLRYKVNARKIAIAQSKNDAEVASALAAKKEAERKAKESVRIIPAKIISRSSPRYPADAQKSNIEGWVTLRFTVNLEGVPQDVSVADSKPKGVFDQAALKSIKKWFFSPARNQETGEAVISKPITTKINFTLDNE